MNNTQLMWIGTKHNLSKIPGCGRALTLGAAHVAQSDDVRVLGVQLGSVTRLRSADRGHLDFPRMKLASYGGRSFAYAGPSNWNSLPAHLTDNSLSLSSFKRHLKTFLFSFY